MLRWFASTLQLQLDDAGSELAQSIQYPDICLLGKMLFAAMVVPLILFELHAPAL